ncbi:hypothetical protein CENSYa_0731 [Cenarchaeum symbiosum A]|uniref:Uncharacterized protein n=1 Tax=Cenarchaeum symbiosum (strain A) TaxID=414004 RepID=A0RVJ7_CENSY|nr:hypothetical protein CENSYa_0731 [Cenarchaeum symbiosum A]
MDQEVICMKEYKAAGSGRGGCRDGPGDGDMTSIGRLGRMIRIGRLAGMIRGLGARIMRSLAGPGSPGDEPAWDTFKAIACRRMGAAALLMALLGVPAAYIGYKVEDYNLAVGLAALLIMPGVVMLAMLWTTRGEVIGLKNLLNGISDQLLPKKDMAEMAENIKGMRAEMLPKKDMAEMAENIKGMRAEMLPKKDMAKMAENIKGIKTESEKTREILGGMAETLKSIDGKLDGNPGPSGPKRPDP